MKNNMKSQNSDVNSVNSNRNNVPSGKKRLKRKKYNSFYLHLQIILTIIIVVSSILLKVKNNEAFFMVKEDYQTFFTTEEPVYSNFSYKVFLEKFTAELAEKYGYFTQVYASLHGKGSSSFNAMNVSTEKYTPDKKGIIPVNGTVTSNFGIRKNPFNPSEKDFHTGMDIAAAKGSFIKSAFDGTVTETGYNDISGNYIRIESSDEFSTFYGHTQFVFVNKGSKVLKGQVIATVGDTGLVTGPHLHFEAIYNGNRVNPVFTVK